MNPSALFLADSVPKNIFVFLQHVMAFSFSHILSWAGKICCWTGRNTPRKRGKGCGENLVNQNSFRYFYERFDLFLAKHPECMGVGRG